MIVYLLYVIGIILAWPMQLIFFKRKTYYVNKKAQSRRIKGGAILLSNHKSFKDFMVYIFSFPFRKVYCLMSEKVFGINKIVSFLSMVMGGILVDRRDYNFAFIERSVELLNKNKLLMVFPEGKLPRSSQMGPFYPSYIMIALKSGKPIIPLYTPGRYGLFKRARMVVGEPIYIRDYIKNDNPTKEEINEANIKIRKKILELETFCKNKMLEEKYHRFFSFRHILQDFGRLHVFFIDLIVLRFKRANLGENKYKQKIKDNLIIVANHISFSDPLIVMGTYLQRRQHMLVSEVVYDGHKFRSRALNDLGCIRIDRYNFDAQAMGKCEDILNGKGVVSLFPEGRISRDGLSEFKMGAAYLSIKTNTKVLPLYIEYRNRGYYRFIVHYGDLIDPSTLDNSLNRNQKIKALNDIIYNNVKGMEAEFGGKMEPKSA